MRRFMDSPRWQEDSWINMNQLVRRIRRLRFITAAEDAFWREAMEDAVFFAGEIVSMISR